MRILFIIFFTIFIQSCENNNLNDTSKRNEKWVWFTDNETGNGEWISIGTDAFSSTGKYTLFYHSGKVFEKGKVVDGKKVDTIFTFDINEKLIKYTIPKPDTTIYYYLNEGIYKDYLPSGELLKEGIVENHSLKKVKGYTYLGHYIDVMEAMYPTNQIFRKFLLEMASTYKEAEENNETIIPANRINKMDSLLNSFKYSLKNAKNNLGRIKPFRDMPELKNKALELILCQEKASINEFKYVINLFKQQVTDKSKNQMISSLSSTCAYLSEKEFNFTQNRYSNKFRFTDEEFYILNNKFPDNKSLGLVNGR